LTMNPQMGLEVLKSIKEQGEQVNVTMLTQMGRRTTEEFCDVCLNSDSHIVNVLGQKIENTLAHLDEKKLQMEDE
jgi:hypothetical protein